MCNAITNPSTTQNFNNSITLLSSLFVSGTSIFQGASSTLTIVGNIIGSVTALTNLNYNAITNPPTIPNLNYPITCLSTLNIFW